MFFYVRSSWTWKFPKYVVTGGVGHAIGGRGRTEWFHSLKPKCLSTWGMLLQISKNLSVPQPMLVGNYREHWISASRKQWMLKILHLKKKCGTRKMSPECRYQTAIWTPELESKPTPLWARKTAALVLGCSIWNTIKHLMQKGCKARSKRKIIFFKSESGRKKQKKKKKIPSIALNQPAFLRNKNLFFRSPLSCGVTEGASVAERDCFAEEVPQNLPWPSSQRLPPTLLHLAVWRGSSAWQEPGSPNPPCWGVGPSSTLPGAGSLEKGWRGKGKEEQGCGTAEAGLRHITSLGHCGKVPPPRLQPGLHFRLTLFSRSSHLGHLHLAHAACWPAHLDNYL